MASDACLFRVWTIVHQMHSFLSQVRNKNRWGENNRIYKSAEETEKRKKNIPNFSFLLL